MISRLLLLFCLALFNRAGAQETEASNKLLSQRMDAFLTSLVEKNGFSGAVLVMKNDQEILKKGYGYANREAKTAYTPQTLATVGSVTKQFTGTAILKLEMMGKLSVNDALEKFFPDAPDDKEDHTAPVAYTYRRTGSGIWG